MPATPFAIVLCKFADQPPEPRPPQFYANYFTEAGGSQSESAFSYWRDVSYRTVDLTGSQVFGWFTMTHTTQELGTLTFPGDRATLAQWGVDAAAANGVNLGPFFAVMVMLNVPTDHGSVGGRRVVISYEQGRWEPTFIFHDMGHALGLGHSWSANPDTVYGDRWDLMSAMNVWRFACAFDEGVGPNSGPGLNAPNLEKLGAIPSNRIWYPTGDSTGGAKAATLAALNHPEVGGYLMMKFEPSRFAPGRLNSTYTVEFRQKDGWDRGIPRSAVLVHEVRADGRSFLLSTQLLEGRTGSDLQSGDTIMLNGKVRLMAVLGPAGGGAPTASNAFISLDRLAPAVNAWGNPVGYASSVDVEAARVVYRGRDDGVHELWLTEQSVDWQHANLSAQTGAPKADHDLLGFFNAEPRAYYTPLRDAARIVYRGDDAHIHELWLTPTSAGWQHADLTVLASGVPASGEPFGYYTPLRDAARVVYRGPADHIHELWLTEAGVNWQNADLTALTGGPSIWGDPAAYYTPLREAARVVYRGHDRHIRELWLTEQSVDWQHADLTAQTGAPLTAGEPFGYYTPLRQAARVVYRGHDDHVHELWLTEQSVDWQHADLTALT